MRVIRAHDYGPDYAAMQPNLRALKGTMVGLIATAVLCGAVVVFCGYAPAGAGGSTCRRLHCKGACMRRVLP